MSNNPAPFRCPTPSVLSLLMGLNDNTDGGSLVIFSPNALYDYEQLRHEAVCKALNNHNVSEISPSSISKVLVGKKPEEYLDTLYDFFLGSEQFHNIQFFDGFNDECEGTYYDLIAQKMKPVDGVCELLQGLKEQGIKYCLVSPTDHYSTKLELEATGLQKYFDYQNTFNPGFKEADQMIEDECHKIGIRPEQIANNNGELLLYSYALIKEQEDLKLLTPEKCVVVGSSIFELKSAESVRMRAIAFVGAPSTDRLEIVTALRGQFQERFIVSNLVNGKELRVK